MLITFFERERSLLFLLWLGIGLRIVLYITISPYGADAHGEIINFIAVQQRLPLTREAFCAMHPPLYYLLSQPFFAFDDLSNPKITQLLSLLFSCLNLYLVYLLSKHYFKNIFIRNLTFLLAIFLHSYLTFSLYVTNDSLSFLIGTWCFWLLSRYFQNPSPTSENWLAVALGLGLLTKGTFIAFVPVIFGALLFRMYTFHYQWLYIFKRFFLLGFITLTIGGYKFAENWYYEGRPIVHNMDIFPLNSQKTYLNARSFYAFDFVELLKNPIVYKSTSDLLHVYPAIAYATFWYKFADLENDFHLGVKTDFKYIGSLIYVFALIPTLVILLGLLIMCSRALHFFKNFGKKIISEGEITSALEEATWLGLLLMSIALVLTAGFKYDAWSCFHGRLFLQAFFSLSTLFYIGLSYLQLHHRFLFKVGSWGMICLAFLYTFYFGIESLYKFMG